MTRIQITGPPAAVRAKLTDLHARGELVSMTVPQPRRDGQVAVTAVVRGLPALPPRSQPSGATILAVAGGIAATVVGLAVAAVAGARWLWAEHRRETVAGGLLVAGVAWLATRWRASRH